MAAPIKITLNIKSPVQQVQQGPQLAEVSGTITKVDFPATRNDPTTFRIHCPNINKTFDAVCSLYCPVRQGDTIYALCMIGPDQRLHLTRAPFVQPPLGKEYVTQCFTRIMKHGHNLSIKLFNIMSRMVGNDDAVIGHLSNIAQLWEDTHAETIISDFNGFEPDSIKKFLSWWHRERNLRRLYLFGLNKQEINACRATCDTIYERCVGNVYTLPAIPLEKCADIMDRQNKRPKAEDKIRGEIIRYIWLMLHRNGWSGVPTRMLMRQYPKIKDHVEALKEQYGMVAELETAYLIFPNRVEKFLCDYFAAKQRANNIEYDTPLDVQVTGKDNSVFTRHSAHYTRPMSEDQMKGVQGALDHTVSILTGGAGTGKCLGKNTPVFMYDGSIKMVQDLVCGDQLMGPDSKSRHISGLTTGFDNMYEICPSIGSPFVCNSVHMLTLSAFKPFVVMENNTWYACFSTNGVQIRKVCGTRNHAEQFIATLDNDIIDVPLNEYIERKDRDDWLLYHVAVNFPEQNVAFNPYMIGFWLGHGSEQFNHRISEAFGSDRDKYHHLARFAKHLPLEYKVNSSHIRLQVLAGVIDKAGQFTENSIMITVGTEIAAKDVEYLILSLGFMAEILRTPTKFIVAMSGDNLQEIPSVLHNRKKLQERNQYRANNVAFEVRPVGPGEYYGFQLSGDGRFLLGNFLVTHNTTCITQIVHNLELRGVSYALCSFTGKAVARLREVTKKRNSSTMHRLIARSKKDQLDLRNTQFEKDVPLAEYEHVIIDETSMVTSELMYDFLQAYPNIKRLTLVGDVNQLPPIGWGTMLQQLMKSETIPTYRLTTNYRVYTQTGERDGVILNANAIISHDAAYPFQFVSTSNFSLMEGPVERVYDIIKGCFAGGIAAEQIVVISPFNRFLDIINKTFQEIYNVGARFVVDSRCVKWMIGDRVMLTANDEEIGVFNGESGLISDLTEKAILVDFKQSGCHEFLLEPSGERAYFGQGFTKNYYKNGGKATQVLDGDEGDDDERTVKKLQHSYALTVDKSQGSEWDFVILYIPEFNNGSFLNKNRIYTAITRTKRCCWCVVSDIPSMEQASVKLAPWRCENLGRRLKETLPNLLPFQVAPKGAELLELTMKNDLKDMPGYVEDPDDTPNWE